ncbi:MAG: WecB/TagA/CpsF family glycosyltransferase [Gemmatimonadota bacterium]|nr:WecB/TagA/CpsF family glycosyltransferase [Gemmatimonadota bacterium]
MIDRGKVSILGVAVDAVDYEAAVERITQAARDRRPFIVTAQPVHGIMTAARDAAHRFRLNSFDLVVPDGQPVRWAMNLLHRSGLKERVYGPNLMLALCRRMETEGLSIYLFGSRAETVAMLHARLMARFPALKIAGAQAGRFRVLGAEERATLNDEIRSSGAALIFAGLGCPRQEIWAYENRESLAMPIVCVGAAFDFHAGTVRQAPIALQRAGLEWAFRFANEPRRLWKRYVLLNPMYIAMIAAQAAGIIGRRANPGTPPERETNLA